MRGFATFTENIAVDSPTICGVQLPHAAHSSAASPSFNSLPWLTPNQPTQQATSKARLQTNRRQRGPLRREILVPRGPSSTPIYAPSRYSRAQLAAGTRGLGQGRSRCRSENLQSAIIRSKLMLIATRFRADANEQRSDRRQLLH